jgi:AraC-like DNA-binding protein
MRNPTLKKIDSGINHDFFEVLIVNDKHFYPLWHYHPQYEFMFLQEGKGNYYVGDCINTISEGQIFFLGPNIPHLFRNYPEYFLAESRNRAKATVLYINQEFMRNNLFEMSEFAQIRELLQNSKRGLVVKEEYAKLVAPRLKEVVKMSGIERILEVISMLQIIATKIYYEPLASIGYVSNINAHEVARLNRVFDYLLKNFSKTIKLQDIADIANMSPTTFCRYFKKITNKSLINFLNEIRIGYASKLLIEDKTKNISQICFESGFHNLTNFYIQFQKIKKVSPMEFKNSFQFQG